MTGYIVSCLFVAVYLAISTWAFYVAIVEVPRLRDWFLQLEHEAGRDRDKILDLKCRVAVLETRDMAPDPAHLSPDLVTTQRLEKDLAEFRTEIANAFRISSAKLANGVHAAADYLEEIDDLESLPDGFTLDGHTVPFARD